MTDSSSNGILSEAAAADEARAREARGELPQRGEAPPRGSTLPSWKTEELRREALNAAVKVRPPEGGDVASLLSDAQAIAVWLEKGESS